MWPVNVERPSGLVAHREVIRDYGFPGNEIIVDHSQHGRLLVVDGFAFVDGVRNGAVRWEHGLVVKLLADDTFEALDGPWNDDISMIDAVLSGGDASRPIVHWEGFYIQRLVHGLGFPGS